MKTTRRRQVIIAFALRDLTGGLLVQVFGRIRRPSSPRRKLQLLTKALMTYRQMLFGDEPPASDGVAEAAPEDVEAILAATAGIRAKLAADTIATLAKDQRSAGGLCRGRFVSLGHGTARLALRFWRLHLPR